MHLLIVLLDFCLMVVVDSVPSFVFVYVWVRMFTAYFGCVCFCSLYVCIVGLPYVVVLFIPLFWISGFWGFIPLFFRGMGMFCYISIC